MSQTAFSREGEKVFWADRSRPRMVGDFLNRAEVVRMLAGDGLVGKKILDAGCGSGYVARALSEKGARVWGIDRDQEMIREAKRLMSAKNTSLVYQPGKIEYLPYDDAFFDLAICVSVLPYNDVMVADAFFEGVSRVLKPGWRCVVSLAHPDLYRLAGSEQENEELKWIRFSSPCMSSEDTLTYTQEYFDLEGKSSVQEIYAHMEEDIIISASRTRLSLSASRVIEYPEVLREQYPQWGSAWGYPAYLILEFRK